MVIHTYVHMYINWQNYTYLCNSYVCMFIYRSSVINIDQLQIVADKLFWVLYIDCVSLSPTKSLDACFLATTAALKNGKDIATVHLL